MLNSLPSLRGSLKPEARSRAVGILAELGRRAKSRHPDHARYFADCAAFINECVIIDEPHGDGLSTIPFHLWPAQADVIPQLADERLLLFLKARQVGVTWLVLAYALWLCLFRPGRVVLLFSKTELEAYELVRRMLVMWQRLPDWLRAEEPLIRDSLSALEWGNGSRVQSLAATRGAGRSFTASLAILDEFAFMAYGPDVYTALKPTVDGGGKLIIISTANGEGGLFPKLWQDAVANLNNFKAIFLSWRARPDRDEAWRNRVSAEALSSALDKQEYPNTPDDSFQATAIDRFLPNMILWDACHETLPALTRSEPIVIAADAGVTNDSFGLLGVTRHPARHADIAVRFLFEWKPRGKPLDFLGTEDAPGPERVLRWLCGDANSKIVWGANPGYNVVCVTYDPYQLHSMMTSLSRENLVWCKPFNQGGDRLEADKQLLDLIMAKRIAHDGNAQLRAHIDNADRKPDAETRKLRIVKREEALKVDLAVCLAMASYTALYLNL